MAVLNVAERHASSNIATSSPTELSAGMLNVSSPNSFYSLLRAEATFIFDSSLWVSNRIPIDSAMSSYHS